MSFKNFLFAIQTLPGHELGKLPVLCDQLVVSTVLYDVVLFQIDDTRKVPVREISMNNKMPRPSYNGQDIRKSRDLKNFHNGLIHMANDHTSLLVHNLLRRQQHTQSGG